MVSDLSTLFAALADPTRRAILARLSTGDAPVKDLVEPFGLSGPAITKHLKVLQNAGLISRSREGQQRPCRLEPQALAPAADWIDQYRSMWEDRFDRLDAYLQSIAPKPRKAAARPRRAPQAKATPTQQKTAKKPTLQNKSAQRKTAGQRRAEHKAAKQKAAKQKNTKRAKAQKLAGGRHGHRK